MVYEETDSRVPVGMLPEIYQDLAGTLGIEATLTLGREFGGMSLYLPKIETSLRGWLLRANQFEKSFQPV